MSLLTTTVRLFSVMCLIAASSADAQAPPTPAKKAPVPASKTEGPRRTDPNLATPGSPELPKPRLKLTEGPFIDGKAEKISQLNSMYISPAGQLVVRVGYAGMQVYDAKGRRLWRAELANEGEIGNVSAVGWQGAQMWIADPRFSQIALVDHGVVTKSLEVPTWIRPKWVNRKDFPVFGAADVRALFPDGSMLVVPYRPHSVVDTPGYDSTMSYLVRVAETGLIQTTITKYPSIEAAGRARWERSQRGASEIPNGWLLNADFWPRLKVSADGMRVVLVSVDTTNAMMDSIVVAAFNDQGQPLYTRKFGFRRQAFTQHDIDSIAAGRFRFGDPALRARQKSGLPRKLPAVHDAVIGRDYSVWITLNDVGAGKPIVGIDATGQIIGTAYIPSTFQIKAADGADVWLADYRNSIKDIVRYTAAKP